MASQGMILRNMNLVGTTAKTDMPEEMKKVFEEGCFLIFMRWTALQLAIHNEWGGSDSKDKAQSLLEEVIDWFYTAKDHEMSDLEEVLDEAIQVDFNVQAEDDSPYMVARSLVNMYNQVAHGDVSYVETLRQQYISQQQNNTGLANSMKDPSNTHGMVEDDDESSSSSGSDESDMDVDMEDGARNEPIIDEDGFQVVQSRRGNRRQQH